MKKISFGSLLLSVSYVLMGQFTEPTEVPNGLNLTAFADVIAAKATSSSEDWTFTVTIASPDKGCDQYADWWEILDTGGQLLYRRILMHSHVNEQPFSRSGGPVVVNPSQIVWIRAHMNNTGYGGNVLTGTIAEGFKPAPFPDKIGKDLENVAPQPSGCNF